MIDYIILALICVAIVLLVSIFVALLLKNRKKEQNENTAIQELIDQRSEDIVGMVRSYVKNSNDAVMQSITYQFTLINNSLTATGQNNSTLMSQSLDSFREAQSQSLLSLEAKLMESVNAMRKEITTALSDQRTDNVRTGNDNKELLNERLNKIQEEIANKLKELREENQSKLDQMREVVDNKLQSTLNQRINESFKVISEQLQAVHKGLGEMTNLTNGVNNLNKIMSNVKTRGVWGEMSLDNLLEQILTAEQYGKQVSIKGREMVDFAIFLPGKNDKEQIILPLDAKFPLADYEELVEASESYDKERVITARKNLIKRIKDEAKSISTKYINVPDTTNFAIMYLPIEGLFAEVVKEVGLLDELQNKYKIVLSGPTTLTALLNSLQMGFKTLQIQKYSSKVWEALSKFKTEFTTFAESLNQVQKQANTVVTTIEKTVKKTNKIDKILGTIEYEPMEISLIEGEDETEKSDDNNADN